MILSLFFFPLGTAWPQTSYGAKDNFELFIPPNLECWNYKQLLTQQVLCGAGNRTEDFIHLRLTLYLLSYVSSPITWKALLSTLFISSSSVAFFSLGSYTVSNLQISFYKFSKTQYPWGSSLYPLSGRWDQ